MKKCILAIILALVSIPAYSQFAVNPGSQELKDYPSWKSGKRYLVKGSIYYGVSLAALSSGTILALQKPVERSITMPDGEGNMITTETISYTKNEIGAALIGTGLILAVIGTTKIGTGRYLLRKAKLDYAVKNGAVVVSF